MATATSLRVRETLLRSRKCQRDRFPGFETDFIKLRMRTELRLIREEEKIWDCQNDLRTRMKIVHANIFVIKYLTKVVFPTWGTVKTILIGPKSSKMFPSLPVKNCPLRLCGRTKKKKMNESQIEIPMIRSKLKWDILWEKGKGPCHSLKAADWRS